LPTLFRAIAPFPRRAAPPFLVSVMCSPVGDRSVPRTPLCVVRCAFSRPGPSDVSSDANCSLRLRLSRRAVSRTLGAPWKGGFLPSGCFSLPLLTGHDIGGVDCFPQLVSIFVDRRPGRFVFSFSVNVCSDPGVVAVFFTTYRVGSVVAVFSSFLSFRRLGLGVGSLFPRVHRLVVLVL